MWSVGIILYVLLCGYTPFAEENQEKMFERIKQGDWSFDEKDWDHVSADAKDLVRSMLTVDIDRRITAKEALRSKWFKDSDDILASRDLSESHRIIKEKRPRLRDLARAFMSMGITSKNALKDTDPIIGESSENQLT